MAADLLRAARAAAGVTGNSGFRVPVEDDYAAGLDGEPGCTPALVQDNRVIRRSTRLTRQRTTLISDASTPDSASAAAKTRDIHSGGASPVTTSVRTWSISLASDVDGRSTGGIVVAGSSLDT